MLLSLPGLFRPFSMPVRASGRDYNSAERLFDGCHQVIYVLTPDGIKHEVRLFPAVDDAGFPEDGEVLGYVRNGWSELLFNLTDVFFSVHEKTKYFQADGMSDGFENLCHHLDLIFWKNHTVTAHGFNVCLHEVIVIMMNRHVNIFSVPSAGYW